MGVWLSRRWAGWRDVLVFVQPSTVIAWQRRRFRDHGARLCRGAPGRPAVARPIRDLIRQMFSANTFWGSPRKVRRDTLARSNEGAYLSDAIRARCA